MPALPYSVTAVPVPAASRIAGFYARTDLIDAYAVTLPEHASRDPETLARFVFSRLPPWALALMAVRDALVAGFGLKTSRQLRPVTPRQQSERVGLFRIYTRETTEIVLGEDDRHLDFRLSLLCTEPTAQSPQRQLVLSTAVHCHNRLGRVYITLIAPFHRRIVRACLRQAARGGWPAAAAAG